VLANLTLPALPTSVVIGGLVTDEAYSIRAAAWTQIGLGPASDAQVHRMEALSTSKVAHPVNPYAGGGGEEGREPGSGRGSDPSRDVTADIALVVQETWFILLLGGILLAILLLLVVALLVRRNLARKKALSLALNKPNAMDDHGTMNGSVRARDATFWSRGWSTAVAKDAEMDAQATLLPHLGGGAHHTNRTVVAPPEYAELLGHAGGDAHLSLSSFMPRRNMNSNDHPAAYATTTLVTQRMNASPYATSAAVVPGMMGGGGGGGGGGGHPPSSDSSGYTTDELGDRCRRPPGGSAAPGYLTKTQTRQTSNTNVKLPNLGQLFPPPPRHPPPSSPSLAADRSNEVCLFHHQSNPIQSLIIQSLIIQSNMIRSNIIQSNIMKYNLILYNPI